MQCITLCTIFKPFGSGVRRLHTSTSQAATQGQEEGGEEGAAGDSGGRQRPLGIGIVLLSKLRAALARNAPSETILSLYRELAQNHLALKMLGRADFDEILAKLAAGGDTRALNGSLQVLEDMSKLAIQPTEEELTRTLSMCENAPGEVRREGINKLVYIGLNCEALEPLLRTWAMTGHIEDATWAFDLIRSKGHHPSLPSYEAIIHGERKQRRMARAEKLVQDMMMSGLRPSAAVMQEMIVGYAHVGHLAPAREWYERLVGSGMQASPRILGRLAVEYIKMGDEDNARFFENQLVLLGEALEDDVVAAKSSQHVNSNESDSLLEDPLLSEDSGPISSSTTQTQTPQPSNPAESQHQPFSTHAYAKTHLANIHATRSSTSEVIAALQSIVKHGGHLTPRAIQTLIKAHRTDAPRAVELIRKLRAEGAPLNEHNYTQVLRICRTSESYSASDVVKLYKEFLTDEGWEPDRRTYHELVVSCVDGMDVETLQSVLRERDEAGVPTIVETENKILDAVLRRGGDVHPWEFLSDLGRKGLRPDLHTYGSLIWINIVKAGGDYADELFAMVERDGLVFNQKTVELIMDAYAKVGNVDGAERWLDYLRRKGIAVSTKAYNCLINAHVESGDVESAEIVMAIMRERGVEADQTTFGAIAKGYVSRNQAVKIRDLMKVMRREGHVPDLFMSMSMIMAILQGSMPAHQAISVAEGEEKRMRREG
ncbi:hypothetical protein HDV00_010478, partial [Rhizophlyctis rosea]